MPALHPLHRLWRHLPAERRRQMMSRVTAAMAPRPDRVPPAAAAGLAIAGEIARASGLGETARLMHHALVTLGVPNWMIDVGTPVPGGPPLLPAPPIPAAAPLILHVNGPYMPWALRRLGAARVSGRRVIGHWAWELPVMPAHWRVALPFLHEIWACSPFIADAVRGMLPPGTALTVRVVPPALALTPPKPAPIGRAGFGLPADQVIVLVSFNLASSFARKNPLAAIAAFRAAFGDRADRLLLLKIGHAEHNPDDLARIRQAAAGVLQRDENAALIACADIVLSLHRSEGLGLVPAEAMLLGIPVVATGWSGNMLFMDAGSAALVPYRLVDAEDERGVYAIPGARWAEPDPAAAAARLRDLADNAEARRALGQAGQAFARHALGVAPLAGAVRALGLLPA
jgi:glycosyltransferase involved in cell wall biosynthesis